MDGATLESITEEQYYLAKYAGIGILESNAIPDFEREAMLHLVIKTFKDELEAIKKSKK